MKFPADNMSDKDIHKNRWKIHAIMSLGLVLVVMSVSSVNVALPTIAVELGATATQLQWIVDSYAIVFAGLLLFAGAVGDRFSRRNAFLAGMLVFGVATFFAAFATTPEQVIAWRAISGIGAAFIMPATLSIIANVFKDNKERAKAVAMWAAFAGAGGAIGPVISGFMLENFWWGSIFLIPIPVIIIALLGGIFITPDSKDPAEEKLDIFGSVLSIVGLSLLLFGIIEGPNHGWTSAVTLGTIFGGIAVLIGFFFWEKRHEAPLLPSRFFKSVRFSIGSLTLMLTFFALFGMFFVLLQYMQFVLGYSALDSAIRLLPAPITLIAVSSQVTKWERKMGSRKIISLGLVIVAVSFILLSFVGPNDGYTLIFLSMILLGGGMALAMPPATEAIIGAVPKRKAGVGSAVNDTTREVGGAMGIAVLGSVLNSGYRSGLEEEAANLPPEAAELAEESIVGAKIVASELGEAGQALATAADQAFADGFQLTVIFGAIFVGISAIIVAKYMINKEDPIPDF